MILLISIGLWIASNFPQPPTDQLAELSHPIEYSVAGRVGKFIEPVFEPLGFDWRISIGILSSFAAREVVVSVLSIIAGVSGDSLDGEGGLSLLFEPCSGKMETYSLMFQQR